MVRSWIKCTLADIIVHKRAGVRRAKGSGVRMNREQYEKHLPAFKIKWDDLPEPDAPPTPLEAEDERLLGWFIKNRRRLAWRKGCERIYITDEGLEGVR